MIENLTITFRRNARARRLSLRLDPSTRSVIITLPPGTREDQGLDWLRRNQRWVERGLAQTEQKPALTDGATILLDGTHIQIRAEPQARRGAWLEGDTLHVSGAPEFLARRVLDFLRDEAKTRLASRLAARATEMGLTPRCLDLRDTRSRWGSCAQTGRIMLSFRLVMAPLSVQDYVIVHELAHLQHFDHSPAFWSLVERYAPHRHAAERWLRREGAALLQVG